MNGEQKCADLERSVENKIRDIDDNTENIFDISFVILRY